MSSFSLFRLWRALLVGLVLAGQPLWAGNSTNPVAGAGGPPPPKVSPPVATPASPAAPASPVATPPAPAPVDDSPSFAPSYTFMTTDQLSVTVYDEGQLNANTRVDTTGCINLSLVGKVKIAGLTISEAQTAIENAYRDQRFLRHPQVTINIQSVATRQVSVEGQVKAPDRYDLPIETAISVVQMVTKAGGFSPSAKGNSVTLTHFDHDGTPHIRTIAVQDILDGKGPLKANDPSLMLQPGDIIFVPESIF